MGNESEYKSGGKDADGESRYTEDIWSFCDRMGKNEYYELQDFCMWYRRWRIPGCLRKKWRRKYYISYEWYPVGWGCDGSVRKADSQWLYSKSGKLAVSIPVWVWDPWRSREFEYRCNCNSRRKWDNRNKCLQGSWRRWYDPLGKSGGNRITLAEAGLWQREDDQNSKDPLGEKECDCLPDREVFRRRELGDGKSIYGKSFRL